MVVFNTNTPPVGFDKNISEVFSSFGELTI